MRNRPMRDFMDAATGRYQTSVDGIHWDDWPHRRMPTPNDGIKYIRKAEEVGPIGEELVAMVKRVKSNPLHTTDDEFARNLVQAMIYTYDIKRKG